MHPETRYVKSGDVHIAYQVMGEGALDLVLVPGFVSNVEYIWEEPAAARCLERLASFSRLILFDKRGTGLSDRTSTIFTLEQRMDDVAGRYGCGRLVAGSALRSLGGRSDVDPVCNDLPGAHDCVDSVRVVRAEVGSRRSPLRPRGSAVGGPVRT